MKILAAGDLHGDSMLTKKLAIRAKEEKVDLVVLCGDLTDFEKSTENIIGPFKKVGKKVLLIPGNHESEATADFLAEFYDVKNIHGYSVKYEDVGLFGCSGVNIGIHSIPEDDIYSLFKKGFDKIKYLKKKIMVSHVHPTGTKMEKMSNFVPGSSGVKHALDSFKPDILLCSHVHEAEGIEEKIGKTKVINVGSEGKIFDI
jgi:Icc-related predicted phosphoesterase